eukprot:4385021-Prymnesium_polylepis.1
MCAGRGRVSRWLGAASWACRAGARLPLERGASAVPCGCAPAPRARALPAPADVKPPKNSPSAK